MASGAEWGLLSAMSDRQRNGNWWVILCRFCEFSELCVLWYRIVLLKYLLKRVHVSEAGVLHFSSAEHMLIKLQLSTTRQALFKTPVRGKRQRRRPRTNFVKLMWAGTKKKQHDLEQRQTGCTGPQRVKKACWCPIAQRGHRNREI